MIAYDEEAYETLRAGIRIDRDILGDELIRNAQDFHHAGEGFAMATGRRDQAKSKLEKTMAEVDNDIRDNAAAEDEKLTEALIKQRVTKDQDYQRAMKVYLSACLEADRWEILRNSYRQRAEMLKALVQLHMAGYFGEVTGSAERREALHRYDRETAADERGWSNSRHKDPRARA